MYLDVFNQIYLIPLEEIYLYYFIPMSKTISISVYDLEELRKENKSLKEKVSELEDISKDYDVLSHDFITATGEIEFWKEEVERFKQNAMADMKEITDLEIENKKLKSDLSECECSFWFEADECWYWKREYKRLKQRIKDHCNGYWNLFPEDEMKRQRKKADKKRKKEEIRVARDEHSYDEIFGDDELIYEEWLYD